MKIKTSELTGAALDWAVAKARGYSEVRVFSRTRPTDKGWVEVRFNPERQAPTARFAPSTDWAQGGPIIEREGIRWNESGGDFYAWIGGHEWIDPLHEPMTESYPGIKWGGFAYGSTLLEAAMRCFVASKLGDEVEIPVGLA